MPSDFNAQLFKNRQIMGAEAVTGVELQARGLK